MKRPEPCPDPNCGAYSGHTPRCALQSVEEKAEQMLVYYEAWLRDRKHYQKQIDHHIMQAQRWQGKFLMLKQENNGLRRRLKKVANSE